MPKSEMDIVAGTLKKLVLELRDQSRKRRTTDDANVLKIKKILDGGLKDSLDVGLRKLGKEYIACCPLVPGGPDGPGEN
jgi:hypothetical protein